MKKRIIAGVLGLGLVVGGFTFGSLKSLNFKGAFKSFFSSHNGGGLG